MGGGQVRRGCGAVGTHSWLPAQLIPLELAGSSHQHCARLAQSRSLGAGGCEGLPQSLVSPQGWRVQPMPCEQMPTPGPALLPPPASPWLSPTAMTGTSRSSSTPVVSGDGALSRFGGDGASPQKHLEHRHRPLWHGAAPNPLVPPRASPPPPGDGGWHHDVPRV